MRQVIYYQGGTAAGQWQRTSRVADKAAADALVAQLERMGYPAMIWDEDTLPTGAPFWWDFATLARKAA